MVGIVSIGVVTSLAVFIILAKTWVAKPKKAEKWEKGEILKQLLALSENENSGSAMTAPPGRSSSFPPKLATSSNTSRTATPPGRNSKRTFPTVSSRPAASARPKQADAQVEDKIRQRAYELYQERGGAGGSSTDDWLQAKQEVLSRKAGAGTRSL